MLSSSSSDETTSLSSFPDSLWRYSTTHFCAELTLQSTVSELTAGTELYILTLKSMYSYAVISRSKYASSLKSALNSSLSISSSISLVSSVKSHLAKQFLIVSAVTSFQALATHLMNCRTSICFAISEASKCSLTS